jgi:hypothetical protein
LVIYADDLFKRWYIDGRIYYHVVVDDKDPKAGIQELRYIDPRKIRKVREVKKGKDPKTSADIIVHRLQNTMFTLIVVLHHNLMVHQSILVLESHQIQSSM